MNNFKIDLSYRTLTGPTTQAQSETGSNGYEVERHTPPDLHSWSLIIRSTLVSYLKHKGKKGQW